MRSSMARELADELVEAIVGEKPIAVDVDSTRGAARLAE